MALNFFNALYQAPMAVAVLSDSLPALQAVKNNCKSSREDVVKEIVVVCHQLITREQKLEIINTRTLLVKPFIENLSRDRPLQSPQHTRMIKSSC